MSRQDRHRQSLQSVICPKCEKVHYTRRKRGILICCRRWRIIPANVGLVLVEIPPKKEKRQ